MLVAGDCGPPSTMSISMFSAVSGSLSPSKTFEKEILYFLFFAQFK